MFQKSFTSTTQELVLDTLHGSTITMAIKREDSLHPIVSGNKLRKLKYNILHAKEQGYHTLLTYGGAYSNHVAAVAAVGELCGMNTIGVIRGEEVQQSYGSNPTLALAERKGMQLHFVSRTQFRLKESDAFQRLLRDSYGNFFSLPEGGTNALAVKGCAEILTEADAAYDFICTAVGTGGTLAGLVQASKDHQRVVGYSVLGGTFQQEMVQRFTAKANYTVKDLYNFGGYAKIDTELIRFMNNFREQTGILLDPVYTGKLLYGIIADCKKNVFPENSRILAIHTGGIQGIEPMNQKLKRKNLPQIDI